MEFLLLAFYNILFLTFSFQTWTTIGATLAERMRQWVPVHFVLENRQRVVL